jgi:hypothetical protein
MVSEFKFFRRNPYENRCRLDIGSSFHYRGYYCTVTRMLQNHFVYTVQETQRKFRMSYEYYLSTNSAMGRQLNRR